MEKTYFNIMKLRILSKSLPLEGKVADPQGQTDEVCAGSFDPANTSSVTLRVPASPQGEAFCFLSS